MIKILKNVKLTNSINFRVIQPDPQEVLWISGNGTPDSTTLIDNSVYARTIVTEFGTYTYSNTYVRPNSGYSTSILGPISGSWRTTLPSSGNNKSWTWETWIYATSDQLANTGAGFGFLDFRNGGYFIMSRGPGNSGNNQIGLLYLWNGNWRALSSSGILANQWMHLAMSQQDNFDGSATLRSFINGTLSGTYTGEIIDLPWQNIIASGMTSTAGFSNPNYYFSDFRITQGRAKYTENFTPPNN